MRYIIFIVFKLYQILKRANKQNITRSLIHMYSIPVDWIALKIVSNAYKWSYAYKYAIQLSDRNPLLLGEILFETHFPKK